MDSTKKQIKTADTILFNGDADGICSLQLLRLAGFLKPNAKLETGVKRDTRLLERISHQGGPSVIMALDIGLDKNIPWVQPLLAEGCCIQWFDHHDTRQIPTHSNFISYIQPESQLNTSRIVYSAIGKQKLIQWMLVGLYGDNMADVADKLGQNAEFSSDNLSQLRRCGELLNYNAYGATLKDLCYSPLEIVEHIAGFDCPLEWMDEYPEILDNIEATYRQDMEKARQVQPDSPYIYQFPNEAWARRSMGTIGNQLIHYSNGIPIAILVDSGNGYHVISVRVPPASTLNAADLCRTFPTGGGRARAAGINQLPDTEIDSFIKAFQSYCGVFPV